MDPMDPMDPRPSTTILSSIRCLRLLAYHWAMNDSKPLKYHHSRLFQLSSEKKTWLFRVRGLYYRVIVFFFFVWLNLFLCGFSGFFCWWFPWILQLHFWPSKKSRPKVSCGVAPFARSVYRGWWGNWKLQAARGVWLGGGGLVRESPPYPQKFRFRNYTNLGGGNSNIFYFHPENWGRWPHFDDHIFQRGGSTTN